MGAGCYYTHSCNKERAAWIDIWASEERDEFFVKNILDDLEENVFRPHDSKSRWYKDKDNYRNGLFECVLESTYHGDGLIVRLEPVMESYERNYNLAMANHHITERSILKKIHALGYKLRIGTSGYTSAEFIP